MRVEEMTGRKPVKKKSRPTELLVNSDVLLGVEIEVEGASGYWFDESPLGPKWAITEDGSLRGGGAEFLFRRPLNGKDAVDALEEFCDWVPDSGAVTSVRTGVHVHIDMRDISVDELRLFAALYSIFEKPLFQWVGDLRSKNIFCLPWHDAEHTIESLSALRSDVTLRRAQAELHRMHKYSAVNLSSLLHHGTAEFRHLRTSFDLNRYLTWINLILSLRNYALSYKGTVLDLCHEASKQGVMPFMRSVFGPHLQVLLYPNIQRDVFYGIRFAQQLEADWKFAHPLSLAPKEVLAEDGKGDLLTKYQNAHNL